ncbi:hypothetical protein SLEP1_g22918 [Rubroshorea leprosula]|uniref:Lachrymatory factor synthase n=1 Tax=Rubroshorea leprosula TaxID=152421 RepID=A0AAV5JJX3_9ROSI|nr:hypothetical protein SLEP1_g22918 [Rubroshorea leprosula]
MMFSYSIVDSNVGFHGYVSTVTVVPEEVGCRIEWSYEVEPVEGWKLEDLDGFIGSGLEVMARRMEAALQALINHHYNKGIAQMAFMSLAKKIKKVF